MSFASLISAFLVFAAPLLVRGVETGGADTALSSTNPENSRTDTIFAVHYSDVDCNRPVSMISFPPDESKVMGGTQDGNSTCVEQVACVQNTDSEQCQALTLQREFPIHTSIAEDDVIALCDPTNYLLDEPVCTGESGKCEVSSVTNGCMYKMLLLSKIVESPSLVTSENSEEAGMDEYSYMFFYSDSQCNELQGLRGVVDGDQEFVFAQEANCHEAMACIINPDGPQCKALDSLDTRIISSSNNGTHVFDCDGASEESDCLPVDDTCTMHPFTQCYYRWTTASSFFGKPAPYLAGDSANKDGLETTPMVPMSASFPKSISAVLVTSLATFVLLSV